MSMGLMATVDPYYCLLQASCLPASTSGKRGYLPLYLRMPVESLEMAFGLMQP